MEVSTVSPALKVISASHVSRLLGKHRKTMLQRRLLQLWTHMRIARYEEYSAAAADIQRCIRGYIIRQALLLKITVSRVVAIVSRHVKGRIIRCMKTNLILARATARLTRWYARCKQAKKLLVLAKHLRVLRGLSRIKSAFRTYRARSITRALRKEVESKFRAATRIQSLFRQRRVHKSYLQLIWSRAIIKRVCLLYMDRQRPSFRQVEETVGAVLLRVRKRAKQKLIPTQFRIHRLPSELPLLSTPEEDFIRHKRKMKLSLALLFLRHTLCSLYLRMQARTTASRIVESKKEERRLRLHETTRCALFLQRFLRGSVARIHVAILRKEFKEAEEERLRHVPPYYRLQLTYNATQNLLHRGHAIIIQSAYRRWIAKKALRVKREIFSGRRILKRYRGFRQIQDAKAQRNLKQKERIKLVEDLTSFQAWIRGWSVRQRMAKGLARDRIICFILFKTLVGCISKAVQRQKIRIMNRSLIERSIIRLQSLARRYLARLVYLKSYQKLVKARTNRNKRKQVKARLQIQTNARGFLARRRVARRRETVRKEREAKELEADVEANLDAMHEAFLVDLHAMKTQTTVRRHQAKRYSTL